MYLTAALLYGRKINNLLAKHSCSISLTEGGNVRSSVNELRRLSTYNEPNKGAFSKQEKKRFTKARIVSASER